jgi:hypothetical protein
LCPSLSKLMADASSRFLSSHRSMATPFAWTPPSLADGFSTDATTFSDAIARILGFLIRCSAQPFIAALPLHCFSASQRKGCRRARGGPRWLSEDDLRPKSVRIRRTMLDG